MNAQIHKCYTCFRTNSKVGLGSVKEKRPFVVLDITQIVVEFP